MFPLQHGVYLKLADVLIGGITEDKQLDFFI